MNCRLRICRSKREKERLTSLSFSISTIFKGSAVLALGSIVKRMDKDYKKRGSIQWNFTKLLMDRERNIAGRLDPAESVTNVKKAVEDAL